MRRILVIVAAGLGLAGCSSFSMDGLKPAPPTAAVQLDSTPQGADARTSTGQSCKTPCTVNVSTTEGFTVSYALPKYEPLTVPVHVTFEGGSIVTQGTITVDPNPVVGELKPMAPPKPIRKRVRKPRPKAPRAAAAPSAAAPTSDPASAASPFPQTAPSAAAPTR
jgi:hypothetical protein